MPRHTSRLAVLTVAILAATCALPATATDCQPYAAGMRWVASVPFSSHSPHSDIAFRGDLAYAAVDYLRVIDIADPENPQDLGRVSGGYFDPRRVDVDGNLLAAALWQYGVEIYSLANPANPVLLTRYPLPAEAAEVCLVGNHLYVGCLDVGIVVLDLADPANPVQVGGVGGDNCLRLHHRSGFLYANMRVGTAHELVVYSLVDPAAPAETFSWGTDVYDPVPVGTRLYVSRNAAGLSLFSLANPAFPTLQGTHDPDDYIVSATGFGDYAFMIASTADQIACLRAPGSGPYEEIGTVEATEEANVLVWHGDHAYMPGSREIDVFDLRTPEGGAQLIGYHDDHVRDLMTAVAARDGYAYVTNVGGGLNQFQFDVIGMSDPTAPVLLHSVTLPGELPPESIALGGDYAYVPVFGGVGIVDIGTISSSKLTVVFPVASPVNGVAVVAGLLYIATADGLVIASLADDPTAPVFVGEYVAAPEGIKTVAAQGSQAVAIAGNQMLLFDVEDPTAPMLTGQLTVPYATTHLAVRGQHAYFNDNTAIHIAEISDPAAPVHVGELAVPGWPLGLALAGDALYVAAYTAGVQVIDVADPADPRYVGSLDLQYLSRNVAVDGGVVLVTSEWRFNVAPLDCGTITAVLAEAQRKPSVLSAAPNPFNPATRIRYVLLEGASVRLVIYDAAGRLVRTLTAGVRQDAGVHAIDWDGLDDAGRGLPSGVYLLRLQADEHESTSKLTLVR